MAQRYVLWLLAATRSLGARSGALAVLRDEPSGPVLRNVYEIIDGRAVCYIRGIGKRDATAARASSPACTTSSPSSARAR